MRARGAAATPHVTRYVLGWGLAARHPASRSLSIWHTPIDGADVARCLRRGAAARRKGVRQMTGGRGAGRRRRRGGAGRLGAAVRRRVQARARPGHPASARLRPLAVGQPRPRRRSRPGDAAQGLGGAQALPGRHQHARLDLHHPAQPVPQPDAPRPLQGRMGRADRLEDPRGAGEPGPADRARRHAAGADAPAAAAARGADPRRRRRLRL